MMKNDVFDYIWIFESNDNIHSIEYVITNKLLQKSYSTPEDLVCIFLKKKRKLIRFNIVLCLIDKYHIEMIDEHISKWLGGTKTQFLKNNIVSMPKK